MRRSVSRNDQQFVQPEILGDRAGYLDVSVVKGVESPSVSAYASFDQSCLTSCGGAVA